MNDVNHQRNHLPQRMMLRMFRWHCVDSLSNPQPHTQINVALANSRDQRRVIKWVNFYCHPLPAMLNQQKMAKSHWAARWMYAFLGLNSFVSLISWCVRSEHLAAVIKIKIAPQHFSSHLCKADAMEWQIFKMVRKWQSDSSVCTLSVCCVVVLVDAKRHRPPRMPDREQFANWKVTCFVLDYILANYWARLWRCLGSAHVNSARGT